MTNDIYKIVNERETSEWVEEIKKLYRVRTNTDLREERTNQGEQERP